MANKRILNDSFTVELNLGKSSIAIILKEQIAYLSKADDFENLKNRFDFIVPVGEKEDTSLIADLPMECLNVP